MDFRLTDSALIAAMTALVIALATGGLGLAMAQRGQRQLRRVAHGHWNREALRRQTETLGHLSRDAGIALVRTGAGVLAWGLLALVVPYDRLGVLPVMTLAPAVFVAVVTGRLASRFRRGLRGR